MSRKLISRTLTMLHQPPGTAKVKAKKPHHTVKSPK